jgi:hypothetical protein
MIDASGTSREAAVGMVIATLRDLVTTARSTGHARPR